MAVLCVFNFCLAQVLFLSLLVTISPVTTNGQDLAAGAFFLTRLLNHSAQ
jgi:hypothetical protein